MNKVILTTWLLCLILNLSYCYKIYKNKGLKATQWLIHPPYRVKIEYHLSLKPTFEPRDDISCPKILLFDISLIEQKFSNKMALAPNFFNQDTFTAKKYRRITRQR